MRTLLDRSAAGGPGRRSVALAVALLSVGIVGSLGVLGASAATPRPIFDGGPTALKRHTMSGERVPVGGTDLKVDFQARLFAAPSWRRQRSARDVLTFRYANSPRRCQMVMTLRASFFTGPEQPVQDSFLDALPKPESIDQSLVLAQGTRETSSAAWRVVKLVRPTSDSTAFATGIWQQLRSPAGATPVVWARMTLQITTLAGRSTCDTHFYRGRRFRDDLEVAMATTDVDATDAS